MIFADTIEGANALLVSLCTQAGEAPIILDIPAPNSAAAALMLEWEGQRDESCNTTTMVKGPVLPDYQKNIKNYGLFSLEIR